MSQWFKTKFNSLCISLSLGVLTILVILSAISHDFHADIEHRQELQIERLNQLILKIRTTLKRMHDSDIDACSDEGLLQIRKQVFGSQNISDIGYYYQDRLVCSGTLGRLDKPFSLGKPDLNTPDHFKIWAQTQIAVDPSYRTAVIGYGNYNLVISPDFSRFEQDFGKRWQLYHQGHGKVTHLLGMPDLYKTTHSSVSWLAQSVITCSQISLFCLMSDNHFVDYANQYFVTIAVAIFFALFLMFFTYNRLCKRQYRRNLPEFRTLKGLSNNSFYCLYQPIIDMQSKKIIGCEVLARFKDQKGDLYPDTFIPLIAKNNKTWELTEIIFAHALNELSQLQFEVDKFRVNINCFARDIDSGQVLKLQNQAVNPNLNWVIEVTEDEKLLTTNAAEHLQTLTNAGFKVAIDDFGTGYSNLNSIKELSCHILKIDKSFINQIEGGAIRSSLVPHIVDMAKDLNLSVVAEGIENLAQESNLNQLGVQFGQGYLYGKPMSLIQLQQLISAQS